MDLIPMQSRHIAGVGYDPETQDLVVAFYTGSRYVYRGVPNDVYAALMDAPSTGNYHAMNIRGKYQYEKVTDDASS